MKVSTHQALVAIGLAKVERSCRSLNNEKHIQGWNQTMTSQWTVIKAQNRGVGRTEHGILTLCCSRDREWFLLYSMKVKAEGIAAMNVGLDVVMPKALLKAPDAMEGGRFRDYITILLIRTKEDVPTQFVKGAKILIITLADDMTAESQLCYTGDYKSICETRAMF